MTRQHYELIYSGPNEGDSKVYDTYEEAVEGWNQRVKTGKYYSLYIERVTRECVDELHKKSSEDDFGSNHEPEYDDSLAECHHCGKTYPGHGQGEYTHCGCRIEE